MQGPMNVKGTIDNAFNLRDLVLQEFCSCNYNLIKYKVVYNYIIYIFYYILVLHVNIKRENMWNTISRA